ncbi:FtsX-like permease family protein [Kitasatospora sp. NPDC059646]|uniref:FtsX-like permease family protein n=1 Tax=Kitasatospora sp. NPDC059646 TaxID=3346893 RepID=UPI0036D196FC
MGSDGWGVPAGVRRAGQHGVVLGAAAVTVLVAVAVLAALTALTGSAVTQGMRHRLAADERLSVSVSGRYAEGGDVAADPQVRAALHRALPGMRAEIDQVWHGSMPLRTPLPKAAGAETSSLGLAVVPLAVAEPQRVAELAQGAWPTGLEQVALSESAARWLAVSPGARVSLALSGGGVLSVTVSGVYRELPGAERWWRAWGASSSVDSPAGLALASQELLRTHPLLHDQVDVEWTAVPEPGQLRPEGLGLLRERVERLTGGDASRAVFRGAEPSLQGVRAVSDLPAALNDLRSPMMVARSGMLVPVTMLAVLSAVTMVLTARQLTEFRRAELLLQLARGAGRTRLLGGAALEWALCTVPAALLGVGVAGPLLRVLERLGLPVEGAAAEAAGAAAWAVAGVALVLHGCAALLPVVWTADGGERETPSRSPRRAVAQRAGADLVLAAVAVLAYWQLRQYEGLLSPASSAVGFDPVLVAAPVVMTVAAALLLLRLLPPLGRALESLARRGRGLVAPLSGWQVSRGRAGQAAPVLLMALALAVGALTTTAVAGEGTSDRDRAAFDLGADLRVTGGELPSGVRRAALAGIPGVAAVTPVASVAGQVQGVQLSVLAVDSAVVRPLATPERMASGAWVHAVPAVRSDLERGSLSQQLALLRGEVPVHGMPVAGRPSEVRVRVAVSAADRVGPVWLAAQVEDASGLVTEVQAEVTADGVARTVSLPLASGSLNYPLQVTQLRLRSAARGFPRATFGLTVSAIEGASVPAGARWVNVTRGDVRVGGLGCPGVPGGGQESRRIDAGVCEVSQPGGGLLSAVVRGADPVQGGAVDGVAFGLVPAGTPKRVQGMPVAGYAVPALVNEAFARKVRFGIGGEVRLMAGAEDQFGLRIVGVLPELPGGGDRESAQVLVDLPALSAARAGLGLPPVSDEAWLLAAESRTGMDQAERAVAADPRLGRVESVGSRVAAMAADPFRSGRRSALVLSLALSPVFAVAGFTVHAVGSARSRRREFAVLRAIGVRRRQLAGVLRLEQLAVVGFSVLLGGALGVGLAAVVLPLIVVDGGGRAVFPALELTVGWGWAALVVLATGLGVGAVVLVLSRVLARVDLARELRAGESG